MIIGLTGGLATGKTTISRLLEVEGYIIIDADIITHQLYKTNTQVRQIIRNLFPCAIENNAINRLILAQEIAKSPKELSQLETQIHPIIIHEIKHQLSLYINKTLPVILVAPLLFETGLNQLCDYVVCLYANFSTQQERAMARRHMSPEKFNMLIAHQWTNDTRQAKSDLWVSTNMPIQDTYQIIIDFIQKIQTAEAAPLP